MTGEEKKASHPTDMLAGLTKKNTVYNDSWFAKLAINYLSQRFQDATGLVNFFWLFIWAFLHFIFEERKSDHENMCRDEKQQERLWELDTDS